MTKPFENTPEPRFTGAYIYDTPKRMFSKGSDVHTYGIYVNNPAPVDPTAPFGSNFGATDAAVNIGSVGALGSVIVLVNTDSSLDFYGSSNYTFIKNLAHPLSPTFDTRYDRAWIAGGYVYVCANGEVRRTDGVTWGSAIISGVSTTHNELYSPTVKTIPKYSASKNYDSSTGFWCYSFPAGSSKLTVNVHNINNSGTLTTHTVTVHPSSVDLINSSLFAFYVSAGKLWLQSSSAYANSNYYQTVHYQKTIVFNITSGSPVASYTYDGTTASSHLRSVSSLYSFALPYIEENDSLLLPEVGTGTATWKRLTLSGGALVRTTITGATFTDEQALQYAPAGLLPTANKSVLYEEYAQYGSASDTWITIAGTITTASRGRPFATVYSSSLGKYVLCVQTGTTGGGSPIYAWQLVTP